MSEEVIQPPPTAKTPKKKRERNNYGGGKPYGHCQPIDRPSEVIVDAVVELAAGASKNEVAATHNLKKSEVLKIQTLVGLTPQQYFDQLADRLEPVVEKLTKSIEKMADEVLSGEREENIKGTALAFGILRTHLAEMRGKSPAPTHQTNIQINNLSREDAKKFLLGES